MPLFRIRQSGGSPVQRIMRRDWDERARKNARYYIATDHWQTEEAFDRSGEQDVAHILSDIRPFLSPEAAVLEIGCGIGRMVKPLARQFKVVYGVDVSHEMIKKAKRRLKDLRNVVLWTNNGRDLRPLEVETVDAAISYIVFQHIPDALVIRSYVEDCLRVLSPGGIFKFQVWGKEESVDEPPPEERQNDTWYGHRFSRPEIVQMTQDVGFRVLSVYFGETPMYLWVVAQKPPS